jgi:HK97 family phage prohead protease
MGVESISEDARARLLKDFKAVLPFEKKEEDNGFIRIRGLASTYAEDRHGERVVGPEAFKNLSEFMTNPIMFANHNENDPLGHYVSVEATKKGLEVEGLVTNTAHPWYPMIKAGSIRTFSIGGRAKYDYPDITEIYLHEISVVTVPANPEARFTLAKALNACMHTPELEQEENLVDQFIREYAEIIKQMKRG